MAGHFADNFGASQMLNSEQFASLLTSWSLPITGRAYIEQVRAAEPARLVRSRGTRNTPMRFASQLMGRVIQAESATVEGALVRQCEYDHLNVLEYWDQPTTVPLVITNKNDKRQRTTHTPDYLILGPSGPRVVECKTADRAKQLASTRPHDWKFDGTAYRYEPAAAYFAELGIQHEIWIPDERSELRTSNIDLLIAVRRWPMPERAEQWRNRIALHLSNVLIASISVLCRELRLPDAGILLRGIHDGWLYAPLDRYLLSVPDDALIALTADDFDLGMEAIEICRTVLLDGEPISSIPSIAQASMMIERKRQLDGLSEKKLSERTLRRYRANLRKSNGDIRALKDRPRPGNCKPRITTAHESFLQECISTYHAKASSAYSSHLKYENAFNDKKHSGGFPESEFAVSLNTYLKRVKGRNQEYMAFVRGGKRAANAAAEPTDRRYVSAPISRPFESAQADHYLGDRYLAMCTSDNKRYVSKPWISILRDIYSTEVLALTIGFRSPSRKVLAELLRDCARRHNRLPETIASDGGSDFQSKFYESTLALYGVHKKDRPSGAPRFGGELERLFGTMKSSILWQSAGSTHNDARGRAVSPSHRGYRLAEQDLIDFYHELESAIFDQLNIQLRGERLNSPDVVMGSGLETYPMSGIPVELNQEFMIATSVDAPTKHYTVDRSRGIEVLGRWYWAPGFGKTTQKRVEVRMDPWDDQLVYAWTDGAWVSCRSRGTLSQGTGDILARICRTTLRLDGREELAKAKHEADLSLNKHLSTRSRMFPSNELGEHVPIDHAPDQDSSVGADNIPHISVSWNGEP